MTERPTTSDAAPGSPRYMVNRVIFDLTRRPDARTLIAAKAAFIADYPVSDEERQALIGPDWTRLLAMGALPNLVYRYYMLHGHAPETFPAAIAARPAGT
jgi:hypothetical protein